MIVCSGSIAFDTVRTPFKTVENVLGGSATYFSFAASFFDKVEAVGAVGEDFPQGYWQQLQAKGIGLSNVQKVAGEKTFLFDSSFDYDLGVRKTNATHLNVLKSYSPIIPLSLARQKNCLYVATMPPSQQLSVLSQCENNSLCFLDTIELFIEKDRAQLLEAFKKVDGIVINEYEARMLANTPNLLKAGKFVQELGPKVVVVKKGENGCLLFFGGAVYPFPAFPLEEIVDPTGAGDAFAGGMVGWLSKNGVSRETLNAKNLRQALCYATVMGSFAVEEFSVKRLAEISWQDIEARAEQYKGLLRH